VLPYWPRGRYLELAPKYWAATRARIPENELAVEIGDMTSRFRRRCPRKSSQLRAD
jgi:hypothetical protein